MSAYTYPALVREFLATLDYRSDMEICFQLRNRKFMVTKDLIAQAFGVTKWPADARFTDKLGARNPLDMWKEVTAEFADYD